MLHRESGNPEKQLDERALGPVRVRGSLKTIVSKEVPICITAYCRTTLKGTPPQ
jgi:hypothetical protein